MTGVIYARYSSENQREESIEGQLRECMAFAERNDITILGTYIDRAMSAKTDNRPEFQRMIKDSGKKMFDVILVWKLDRFSRNRYDSAHYKAILKKNNVKVISATEAISQGAEGIILESVLEGMAEYYSAELAEKVNRGMMENALKCRYNGGTLPVGYKLDLDKHFEIDPLTAPVVLETFQHYLDGRTMKELAEELNAKGIKNKRGGAMNINSVARMLQNRHYIGEYSYKDVVTQGGVPTIVPQEIFDAVQEKLAANKKAPARHKAEDDYLLTTKLFCGKCESFMVGESGTSNTERKYRYYKCVKSKKRCGCDKKAIRKDWIEDIVMGQIKKIIFDDDAIEDITDIVMEVQSKENVTLPMLQKQLSDIERGIDNMLNAIQDGIYTQSTKQRLTDLEERRDELSMMIAQEEIKKPLLSRKQVKFWFHRLRKLDTTKLEHKKRLINTFVNAVIVDDDGLRFVFNYKEGTKTVTFKELEESSDLFASARPYNKSDPSGSVLLYN